MNRRLTACLVFGILGLTYGFAQQRESNDNQVTDLQQKRLKLLQERIARVESFVEVGLADRGRLIQTRIDVIEAKLEYAASIEEKKEHGMKLIAEYDKLIEIAEVSARAPVRPPTPGQFRTSAHVHAASELLWLKAERVRVEILLAELEG